MCVLTLVQQLVLLDTGDQEHFRNLTGSFYRGVEVRPFGSYHILSAPLALLHCGGRNEWRLLLPGRQLARRC